MQIRKLDQVGRDEIAIAGGKGANLGELVRLGLPVPPGFVVAAPAYAAQVADWDLAGALAPLIARQDWDGLTAAAAALFREQPLAAELAEGILAAYRELGAPPVAVRSSATAEDLADASFAGQQETFLNVQGEAKLLEAVRACWASLWGQRAVHYRQQRGIDHLQVAMAVVVQAMVPAEAAGVLFTVDPVARRSDRMLVEAARGLGEAVVSGDVTGDLYRIDRGSALAVAEREVRAAGRPVLSDEQVLELAHLGLRLEQHFGGPQDVEFAVAGGRLWLLQARLITTPVAAAEPEPAPPDPKLDFMQRIVLSEGHERYPSAPKPLDQIFYGMMIRALTNAMRLQGYVADAEAEARLRAQVWHTVYTPFPPLRPTARALGHVGLVTRTLARDWQHWWEQGPRPRLLEITRPVDVAALSDQALFDRADAIMQVWDEIFLERFGFSSTLFAHLYVRLFVSLAVGSRRAVSVTSDLFTGLPTATEAANAAPRPGGPLRSGNGARRAALPASPVAAAALPLAGGAGPRDDGVPGEQPCRPGPSAGIAAGTGRGVGAEALRAGVAQQPGRGFLPDIPGSAGVAARQRSCRC
jgi:pyruvate,water dikinase